MDEKVAEVYGIDFHASYSINLFKKFRRLLKEAGIEEIIEPNQLVAIKLHFGEEGNTGFISPLFASAVVDYVKKLGGNPFLTDTNTLYKGHRTNAVDHHNLADRHGFASINTGAPVIIADGLRGHDHISVRINGKYYKEVKIASAIYEADSMVVISHFKGHEVFGFGGALKNLGMGCSIRESKLSMHSTVAPTVKNKKCTGCGICVTACPTGAIKIIEKVARIDSERCIGCADCIAACPENAIRINWNADQAVIQEKLIEHVAGVLSNKKGRILFINFVKNVSPLCDCVNHTDIPVVNDIGILASKDPVAIDQACIDLVNSAPWRTDTYFPVEKRGIDKFRSLYPEIEWEIQLNYAEEFGIGRRSYRLVPLFKARFPGLNR